MGVFFDGVADVEGLTRFDVACLRTLTEGDAVHDVVALVVHEFQFDVLLSSSDHLARAVVIDLFGAEHRFLVHRSEGCEAFQLLVEAEVHVLEIEDGMDVNARLGLFLEDVGSHVGFKSFTELFHVFDFQRESGGVGVSAEVFKQFLAALHRFIDIKTRDGARRTGRHAFAAGQHHGGAIELFRQS